MSSRTRATAARFAGIGQPALPACMSMSSTAWTAAAGRPGGGRGAGLDLGDGPA
ncbi:hypothetical protein [Nonomuraea wenchangensis]|uniref:hypothetical protein n=1 Tax=Nonomuraea wenchangensis TaxID=568860 RepID=UPI00342D0A30